MTREKLCNEITSLSEEGFEFDKHFICSLIDKIFDDFESRKCKNCKYYIDVTDGCKNYENTAMNGGIYMLVTEDFGCNRFERKEDE